jgi:hypothetical protein
VGGREEEVGGGAKEVGRGDLLAVITTSINTYI